METPVTWTQLAIAVIFVLITTLSPQFYSIYKQKQEARIREREDELKQQQMEIEERYRERQLGMDAEETTWKRVVSEYERALASVHRLEQELEQLRPLALHNAVLEQKMGQCREDKEDWKSHAVRLEEQLQEHNIIPQPFKRRPREDTDQQLKTVSRKMKAIKQTHLESSTTDGSPTLVFPPIEGEQK